VQGNLRSFAAFVFSPEFAELSAPPESSLADEADGAEHHPAKTPDGSSGGN
jgi:hypothetical protein